MEQQTTAQVFRAKYTIAWGSKPKEAFTEEKKITVLSVEDSEGQVKQFRGYEADNVANVLDKLGIHYGLSTEYEEQRDTKTNPEYVSQLKSLQAKLTTVDTDFSCSGGGEYSYDIILETPTKEGSGTHIKRRKELEAFLNGWGINFSVECFTVHSDTVCRILPSEEPTVRTRARKSFTIE